MDIVNGLFLGAVVGLIIALPAIISEIFRRGATLPILIDIETVGKKHYKPREVFILSLAAHEAMALLFGGLYMFLVRVGWRFHDFTLASLGEYAFYFWFFIGGIVCPLIRLGFFGRREGRWVWLELLIAHHLFGLGLWAALRLFPIFLA